MDWCSEIPYLHNGRNWVGLWGQSQSHLGPDVAPVVASQEKSHRSPGWLTGKVLLPLEERNNGGSAKAGNVFKNRLAVISGARSDHEKKLIRATVKYCAD